MTEAVPLLFDFATTWMAATFGVFLRIGACFLVLPGIGDAMIPMRVRLMAAIAFTIIVTPAVLSDLPPNMDMLPTAMQFMTEASAGLVIGLALRFTVHALQIAGTIAAQSTSLSQIMGGASPDPQPAMGAILMMSGVALAVLSGLHVHLTEAFIRSYGILPYGTLPIGRDIGGWGVERVSSSFGLALSLSAPFLLASLLYNVALGVINKAMPQLMVAFVGAPAITWGGLFLLVVCIPFILPIWLSEFESALLNPLGSR